MTLRLLDARWWGAKPALAHAIITAARAYPSTENLLMRTLMVRYPHLQDMVLLLKQQDPVVVRMKNLKPPSQFRRRVSLPHSLFLHGHEQYAMIL